MQIFPHRDVATLYIASKSLAYATNLHSGQLDDV